MRLQPFLMQLEKLTTLFAFLAITLILLVAQGLQLSLHELPCPLCLLQRAGFIGIALGFLMNLRFGFRPSHYSIVLLSALLTSFIALRQVSLHVLPGSGAYGDPIFGIHLYTWVFIISMVIIFLTALLLGVDRQYQHSPINSKPWRYLIHVCFILLAAVIVINIISVTLECGLATCPDNPVQYKY